MPTLPKPRRRPSLPARSQGFRRLALATAAAGLLLFSDAGQLRADTASVVDAANAFKATLSSSQISTLQIAYTAANAEQWTNLPGSRLGLQLGTLSSTQLDAALTLVRTALSEAGYNEFNETRLADAVLGQTQGGYGAGNYYVVFTGTPSTSSPWLLQILGHHLAYNITYNGTYVAATPTFLGTEPPFYTDGSGVFHAPLETQRAAVAALADSLQANSAVGAAATLSGTFSDVVHGSNGTNGRDTNFPQAYPTGTTGRGVAYSALSTDQRALVRDVIEAFVNTQSSEVAATLLTRYESAAHLAQTYVGLGLGQSGTASFPAQPSGVTTQRSYLRVDGPRVWIEFIVQQGVVYRTQIHYHSLWRDKVADYGAEFGQASTDDPGDAPTTPTVPTVSLTTTTTAPLVEGGVKGKVFFTRAGDDATAALTVGYTLSGSATNGSDYASGGQPLSGSITIPAGATTAKLKVNALADGVTEGTEKIKLKLSASPTGAYTVGTDKTVRLYISDAN